jgi:hypothetical protein
MKTGTTYVQNLLQSNRAALRRQGWLVPNQAGLVARGVREVLGLTDAGKAGLTYTPKWDLLTDLARNWDGAGSLISMEFLSYARVPAATRVIEGLAGTDVHVVLTVRDAAGALPSQWQSLSRNGGATSWPDFAEEVRSASKQAPTPATRAFARTQDIPRMLRVWSGLVPRERLTVVTVPPSSAPRELLWKRFLSVAGIDAAATSLDSPAFDNPRLGYGSSELLRRLNAAGLSTAKPTAYRRVVRYTARQHLLGLRDSETEPRLDAATASFAADLNRKTRKIVVNRAEVVGSLDELPVEPPDGASLDPGVRPSQVDEAEVAQAAEAARNGILTYYSEYGLTVPDDETAQPSADLDVAVGRLALLMRTAMDA